MYTASLYFVYKLVEKNTLEKRRSSPVTIENGHIRSIPIEQYISLDQLEDREIIEEDEDQKLKIDEVYYITTKDTLFRLRYIKDNLYILQLIKGKDKIGDKIALDKKDCEYLKIPYEENLYPYSNSIILRKFDKTEETEVKFNPNDLSTYSCSSEGHIQYMMLELSGFKNTFDPKIIVSDDGYIVDLELFLISLKVTIKQNIIGVADYFSYFKGDELEWALVTSDFPGCVRSNPSHVVSDTGKIYIIVDLIKVLPVSLKGLSASDIFTISWEGCYSKNIPSTVITFGRICPKYNLFKRDKLGHFWRRCIKKKQVPYESYINT